MNIQDMQKNAEPALKLLKALANESRLMILCHLVEGELTVGELNQRVTLSQSALSQHLTWLRKDQLVSTRKESQTIYYSIASEEAKAVLGKLHELYCK
ncbi:metalloregulator ArsR/SmtB family transcription factor [Agarivorans sp. B2Z047]|uniref:ArsR/SmtB family transcription factor n=1 Tax=Agarivorans sp. B2Z047 TaxID=2652721 RepID=UPI00128E79CA|nr:metalloregulator ArsR/SmtB family transcription factor [Agarivorans sp. B2Z047]MPW30780.1 metalloregulator ArsR/SmtB family transcription factor [Agarivorans sp. B2Z047]UQN41999.1 metalloregulator ArsR/SmtB family transcription factor [Agarivorans sp. B2Z047]